jgi:hypothetical protein
MVWRHEKTLLMDQYHIQSPGDRSRANSWSVYQIDLYIRQWTVLSGIGIMNLPVSQIFRVLLSIIDGRVWRDEHGIACSGMVFICFMIIHHSVQEHLWGLTQGHADNIGLPHTPPHVHHIITLVLPRLFAYIANHSSCRLYICGINTQYIYETPVSSTGLFPVSIVLPHNFSVTSNLCACGRI